MRVRVRMRGDGLIVASGPGSNGRDRYGRKTDQRPSAVVFGLILFSCCEPRDTRRDDPPPAPDLDPAGPKTLKNMVFRKPGARFRKRQRRGFAQRDQLGPGGSGRS